MASESRSPVRDRMRAMRRGLPRQKGKRTREHEARRSAVAVLQWLERWGEFAEHVAERLGIRMTTLLRWRRHWRKNQMRLRARGRPPEEPDRETRREIQAVLALMGPHTGMPTLQWMFPELSRGALLEYQQRYRYAYARQKQYLLYRLLWTRPGTVWAGDVSDPPAPIEGLYQKITNIRDTASSHQLSALPSPDEQSVNVRMVLRSLEKWVGLPLVLKIDNGSCFRAEELKTWCRERGVLLLYSPPRTPKYNGAIEAGTGSIHARAHWEAARHDRPGEWTCDDVEAARLQANETARPRGLAGPTPDEMWAQRVPITQVERAAFLAS